MDRSAVKAIVDREVEPLMERLGIARWKIRFYFDFRDEKAIGQSRPSPSYEQAGIDLDPDGFDDEEGVHRVLRHELFHVLLSPYHVYADAVNEVLGTVDGGEQAKAALGRIWSHADEQAVINLERMYRGLTDRKPAPTPTPVKTKPKRRKGS